MRAEPFFILCLLFAGCASPEPPRGLLGAYRLDSGETVSISRSAESTLRYRIFETGSSGRLYPESGLKFVSGAGFARKEPVTLTVEFEDDETGTAPSLRWIKQDKDTTTGVRVGHERHFRFDSDGVQLFGRLQLPEGSPPYPAVVLVHGSGDSPGTEWFYNSDFFVANGIAALTYDKRGTGRSEGEFTFDFEQLARDGVAAVNVLLEEPYIAADRIGLSGYSQGAWVAPLAASMSDSIRFVIVNYGMIESPAEEARLEMLQLLVDAEVSEADLTEADQLIRAAVNLVANEFESGWPEFDALKERHADAPWLAPLRDTPVGQLVTYPKFLVKLLARSRMPKGLPWRYDSMAVLEASDTPMVWLLAAEDRSAPNAQTVAKLETMQQSGKPFELILFPDAGHGMITFAASDNGREILGYARGYFEAEVAAAWRLIEAQNTSSDANDNDLED
jgi:dienelactone hydrolase